MQKAESATTFFENVLRLPELFYRTRIAGKSSTISAIGLIPNYGETFV